MSTFTHKRTDRGGETFLDWAERHGRTECADVLRALQSTRPPLPDPGRPVFGRSFRVIAFDYNTTYRSSSSSRRPAPCPFPCPFPPKKLLKLS